MAENGASKQNYTGEVVRIALLAGADGAVRDMEFADCQINGPAVIAVTDESFFDQCRWDGSLEALLWEIPPTGSIIGAVQIQRCRFIGCRFSMVGIVGTPDALAKWRQGFAA